MNNMRDFGVLIGDGFDSGEAYSDLAYVDAVRKGQVYRVTHEGGGSYLPFMNRSFISFSFGGKNIEDFDLIATTDGDRLQRYGSSEFEDLVDEYNIIDGQFYWGTHYKGHKFNFKLATDGISQQKLEEFKYWFAGGKTRELILAEHPNRAILARVATPPNITLLPFEEQVEVMINNKAYKTSTTVYKGEIELEFAMDDPFWYSKINIFGHYDEEEELYYDEWTDANGNTINIYNEYENLDVVKIILEDNIPTSGMLRNNMLLGNNIFASLDNTGESGHIAKNNRHTIFKRYPEWSISKEYVMGDVVHRGFTQNSTEYDVMFTCKVESTSGIPTPENHTTDWRIATDEEKTQAEVDIYEEVGMGEPGEITIYILGDQLNDIENEDHKLHIRNILVSAGEDMSPHPPEEEDGEPIPLTMIEWAQKVNHMLDSKSPAEVNAGYDNLWKDTDPHATIWSEETRQGARIVGPHMAPDTGVETLSNNSFTSFYYAGTAPSAPILEFSLAPRINDEGYICTPANSYAPLHDSDTDQDIPYSTVFIRSLTTKEFRFTTPSIYTAFNETMKIFKSLDTEHGGEAWEKIRSLIRDNVKHYAVRAWANRIIDWCSKQTDGFVASISINDQARNLLKQFLYEDGRERTTTSKFSFDSSTGTAIGYFKFREYDESAASQSEDPMPYQMVEIKEDISDMVKSAYLMITERNHPNEKGEIVVRMEDSEYTQTFSHELYHNVDGDLQNIFLKYKNMYL